jgi:hypothetical protein
MVKLELVNVNQTMAVYHFVKDSLEIMLILGTLLKPSGLICKIKLKPLSKIVIGIKLYLKIVNLMLNADLKLLP